MNPKEKAQELYQKMLDKTVAGSTHWVINARKHALICVDEMIKEIEDNVNNHTGLRAGKKYRVERWEYWQQVKQEIEKL